MSIETLLHPNAVELELLCPLPLILLSITPSPFIHPSQSLIIKKDVIL
jgi:hypothetical protein